MSETDRKPEAAPGGSARFLRDSAAYARAWASRPENAAQAGDALEAAAMMDAAPDLLAALNDLLIHPTDRAWTAAREAVRTARGEA